MLLKPRIELYVLIVVAVLIVSESEAQNWTALRVEAGASFGPLKVDGFPDVSGSPVEDAIEVYRNTLRGIDRIDGFEGGIGYEFASGFGLTLKSGYGRGSAKMPVLFTTTLGVPGELVDYEYRITDIPLIVACDYRFRNKAAVTLFDASAEFHFLEASGHMPPIESISFGGSSRSLAKDTVFSVGVAIGVEWVPVAPVAIGARVGYRVSTEAELEDYKADISGAHYWIYVRGGPWSERSRRTSNAPN